MHRLHVPDMKCGGCLSAITRIVRNLDPQAEIEGSLETREVIVTSGKAEALLLSALSEAGYPARSLSQGDLQ